MEAALDFIRAGDVFVVTKLDRLARSVADLCAIVKRIESKGGALRILAMSLDTGTSTGRLMLNVFASVAQFEREVMLERQREGIARAKGEGKYKGRAPTVAKQADQIRAMHAAGAKPAHIAKSLGVARSSVYRMLEEVE